MNEDDDGRERGDEPPYWPENVTGTWVFQMRLDRMRSRICEGQGTPHSHSDKVYEFQYLDKDGANDIRAFLCDRCVAFDRQKGYTLQRTFIEEYDPGKSCTKSQ
jgi:hypothetical protein